MLDRIYPKSEQQFLSHGLDQFTFDETEKLGYKSWDIEDIPDLDDYINWSRNMGLRILIYRGDGVYATNCGYWKNRQYVATYKDIPVWTVAMPRHEWSLKNFYGQISMLNDITHNKDWTEGNAWLINRPISYLRRPVFTKCIELIKKYIDESGFDYEKYKALNGGKDPYRDKIYKNFSCEDITDEKSQEDK